MYIASFPLLALTLLLAPRISSAQDAICRPLHSEQLQNQPPAHFPTLKQLKAAEKYMGPWNAGTLFIPWLPRDKAKETVSRYGSHMYLKDLNGDIWHAESEPLVQGHRGDMIRAWKLASSVEKKKGGEDRRAAKYVMKVMNIDKLQKSKTELGSFHNEVDALKDLGRLVGGDVLILSVPKGYARVQAKYEHPMGKPSAGEIQLEYPEKKVAVFLQTFAVGRTLDKYRSLVPSAFVELLNHRIVEQVDEVRKANWMHCDLRPENFVMDPICDDEGRLLDLKVNIVDFGSALPIGNSFFEPSYDMKMVRETLMYVDTVLKSKK